MTDPKVHLVLIGGINNSAIVWDEFALHSPLMARVTSQSMPSTG